MLPLKDHKQPSPSQNEEKNWKHACSAYTSPLISLAMFLRFCCVHTEPVAGMASGPPHFSSRRDAFNGQVLITDDNRRQTMAKGLWFLLFGVFSSNQEMLAVLFLFQRKGKCVPLIKCTWLGCVSVTNRDVPNCRKIIWVISKSLFLPVCRQFLGFAVCHISLSLLSLSRLLAAYHLISGRAPSIISCKKM